MITRQVFVAGFAGIFALIAASPTRAQVTDVTAPGNPIVGVAATVGNPISSLATVGTVPNTNNYPATESPPNSIDNNQGNKYLNFRQSNAGFIVTPSAISVLTGVRFSTGNDAPERDPFTISIEGTNSPNPTVTLNSTWTSIYNGVSGLATDPGRNTFGSTVTFINALPFTSYRML